MFSYLNSFGKPFRGSFTIKQEKRRQERKYSSTRLEIHKQIFQKACKVYNELIESKKTSYYKSVKMVSAMFKTNCANPPI
jgi:hypothetical protein